MISPEVLRRYPLFAGQSEQMLAKIAMLSNESEVAEGEWIFHENADATHFYIILEGKIALTMYLVYQGVGKQLKTSASLGKGELLGWSALVFPHHYKLGALAETNSRLLMINGVDLRKLLDDNPEYGYLFMKLIAEEISDRLEHKIIQVLSLVIDGEEIEKLRTSVE